MKILQKIINLCKVIFIKEYRENRKRNIFEHKEMLRLFSLPRDQVGCTWLFGHPFKFTDAKTFLGSKSDILDRNIYHFISNVKEPLILDCGANIGLAALAFKREYPKCRLTCFEPDPRIFKILSDNMQNLGFADVKLINKAVWRSETTLSFDFEGNESGRILDEKISKNGKVDCVRLRDYLSTKVDFLKLDIEGAELNVLRDCCDQLTNVERMFVEYHSFLGQKQELDELLRILNGAGFRIFIENSGQPSRNPFATVVPFRDMDLLVNIFAYR